ncbi:hypothetical protein LTS18_011812, partial [Coniosporium uncinatum]
AGWKSIAGTTDFGEISKGESEGCKLAFDIVVDKILGYVASYYVRLNGEVDALVFAGGIGEKGDKLRKAVVDGVRCLGFKIDESKNSSPGDGIVVDIGAQDSKHKVLVCQTDEQLEMARGCMAEADTYRADKKGSA